MKRETRREKREEGSEIENVQIPGFTLKWLNINSPGLSDEGALPRVGERPPTAVRGSKLKKEIGSFRTEGVND